jgi:hypothetical protein
MRNRAAVFAKMLENFNILYSLFIKARPYIKLGHENIRKRIT